MATLEVGLRSLRVTLGCGYYHGPHLQENKTSGWVYAGASEDAEGQNLNSNAIYTGIIERLTISTRTQDQCRQVRYSTVAND